MFAAFNSTCFRLLKHTKVSFALSMVIHCCLHTTLSLLALYVYDLGPAITSSSTHSYSEYSSSHIPKPLPKLNAYCLACSISDTRHGDLCKGLFSPSRNKPLSVSQYITCGESNQLSMLYSLSRAFDVVDPASVTFMNA